MGCTGSFLSRVKMFFFFFLGNDVMLHSLMLFVKAFKLDT